MEIGKKRRKKKRRDTVVERWEVEIEKYVSERKIESTDRQRRERRRALADTTFPVVPGRREGGGVFIDTLLLLE